MIMFKRGCLGGFYPAVLLAARRRSRLFRLTRGGGEAESCSKKKSGLHNITKEYRKASVLIWYDYKQWTWEGFWRRWYGRSWGGADFGASGGSRDPENWRNEQLPSESCHPYFKNHRKPQKSTHLHGQDATCMRGANAKLFRQKKGFWQSLVRADDVTFRNCRQKLGGNWSGVNGCSLGSLIAVQQHWAGPFFNGKRSKYQCPACPLFGRKLCTGFTIGRINRFLKKSQN